MIAIQAFEHILHFVGFYISDLRPIIFFVYNRINSMVNI